MHGRIIVNKPRNLFPVILVVSTAASINPISRPAVDNEDCVVITAQSVLLGTGEKDGKIAFCARFFGDSPGGYFPVAKLLLQKDVGIMPQPSLGR